MPDSSGFDLRPVRGRTIVRLKVQPDRAEAAAKASLIEQTFVVEYISVRTQENLSFVSSNDKQLIVLAAVRIGETRLIDNVQFEIA